MALLALTVVGGTVLLLVRAASDERGIAEAPPDESPRPQKPERDNAGRNKPSEDPTCRTRRDKNAPIGRPGEFSELAQQVSQLRQLPLRTPLRSRLVCGDELADKISDLSFSELDPEEVENDQRLLIALHLAPADFDLAAMTEDLYREQVAGLYVPEEKTLYVGGSGESPAGQTTTAHEITHALQDQSFDMVRLQKKYEDDADASLAVLSLIEGDAVLTQQLWAQEHLTPDQQQQAAAQGGGGEALARVPEYLRASLFFPYTQGGYFVAQLYQSGGYAAVDEAFRNPPTTSEHIMHPDRYLDGDERVDVSIDTPPGAGWEQETKYAFGEFDLRELLSALGGGTAAQAGAGWDGGEVRSWSKGPTTAVGAVLAFDSPDDTAEACDALAQWYGAVADGQEVGPGAYRGDRDHMALACDDAQLRFALAPSLDVARRMIASP